MTYPTGYSGQVTVIRTQQFIHWLDRLRDQMGRAQITLKLRRLGFGHLGDCKPLGQGISELRIDIGPGYRVYLMRTQLSTYVVLNGGDKSTQRQDIKRAKEIAQKLREA